MTTTQTKEGWEELNSLYESFLEIGKNLNDDSRTGTEARIALELVKQKSASLYEKSIQETEQRIVREAIELIDAQAFENDNGLRVELLVNWDQTKGKLKHHYNIND